MERFWSKVSIKGEDDCWEWLSSKQQCGYGKFLTWNGVAHFWMAHRFAWMLWYGDDPGSLKVCHRCDNPGCVNPNHLFLGTQKDNVRDMVRKGRSANKSKTHCIRGHEYSGANLVVNRKGYRVCLTCRRKLDRESKKAARDASR